MVNDGDRPSPGCSRPPRRGSEPRSTASTIAARRRLGRSLRETAVRAVVMGGVTLAVALVLRLPVPFALAMLVFVCGFVPLLGLIAGDRRRRPRRPRERRAALPAILAVAALAGTTILLPRILEPRGFKGHGVHPAVVLVALTIGGTRRRGPGAGPRRAGRDRAPRGRPHRDRGPQREPGPRAGDGHRPALARSHRPVELAPPGHRGRGSGRPRGPRAGPADLRSRWSSAPWPRPPLRRGSRRCSGAASLPPCRRSPSPPEASASSSSSSA